MALAKVVSPELQSLIDQANATFGRGFEIVRRIYDMALGQGFSKFEARDLILETVTAFKKSTLYSYIPDDAKDKNAKALTAKRQFPKETIVPKLERESEKLTIKESHEVVDAETESEPPSAVEQWQKQKLAESEPFTVETTFDIKGVDIPVIVEVVPDKKQVFVRLDEVKARKLGI